MVKNGEASWVILKRTQEAINEVCHLCLADPEYKNCPNCNDTRREPGTLEVLDYGNDLVLISTPPADKKEKKQSSALAKKTPRTATIESKHIIRAYVLGVKEAAERIEEYGRLIRAARMFNGPSKCAHREEFKCTRCINGLSGPIPAIGKEPEDNPETGQGREYDFGRAI